MKYPWIAWTSTRRFCTQPGILKKISSLSPQPTISSFSRRITNTLGQVFKNLTIGYISFIQIICEKPPEVPFRPSRTSSEGNVLKIIHEDFFEVLVSKLGLVIEP
eukprot:TRINITY_DN5480_c0_g1_i5.p1 TRINITY_DN5480_c0_g1~~TRINITY_DN5480_c0_g1_i5.p1  ORF type:complete len:105 (-),score=7.57 TRINITY_DN5480_c0_g1_i5:134-448(-)